MSLFLQNLYHHHSMNNTETKQNYGLALVTLTSLFFMWGFITCLNDVLIPFLKGVFTLSNFQANLVQFAFFTAYFVISLIYFLVSYLWEDPIQKIGYKNTLVAGLLIAATACLLFFLEAGSENPEFGLFLSALFLLGTGFSFLQIAANPLVAMLGTPESSSSRLNLSQAFNSLGTTFSPLIGAFLIYEVFKGEATSSKDIQMPYLILASVLLVLAGVLFFSNVPNRVGGDSAEKVSGAGALKHPYLICGMFGIFCYVGAEVAIGSNLSAFMEETFHFEKQTAAYYLMFYWGGAMIGRFMGSISMSGLERQKKYILMALSGVICITLICLVAVNNIPDFKVTDAILFFVFFALNYVVFLMANSIPSRTLGLFAIVNILLIAGMLMSDGSNALWVLLSVGLFNSIMFSNVFTLSIEGLGKYTAQGSSLLVMMILGGAIVPPLQGLLADVLGSSKLAFAIPMLCYAYLAWFGFAGSKLGKSKVVVVKKEEHPESVVLDRDSE